MVNNELLDYIKGAISRGEDQELIKKSLLGAGWNASDLQEAFDIITSSNSVPVKQVLTAQSISSNPNPVSSIDNSQAYEVMPTEFVAAKPKYPNTNKTKKAFLVAGLIIFFLLASAGVYGYYSGFFISLPGLISQSIDGTRDATSAKYDMTISIDVSNMKSITSGFNGLLSGNVLSDKFTLTTKGEYDISDNENVKSSTTITLGGGSLSFKIELRTLDGALYGQLVKAPVFGLMPMLSAYENKWVSFPYRSKDGQMISSPFSSFTGIDTEIAERITPEQKERLYKITRDASFVKMVKKLPPEKIMDESSYHYLFDLDREGITEYLKSVKEYINTTGKDDSYLSAFDPTSFADSLNNLKDFKGEIWIGRNDKLLRKIVVDFNIKPDENKEEYAKVNIVSIFSDWNEPVFVVAPSESLTFEEFLASPSGPLEQARQSGQEAKLKADLSSLRSYAEIFNDLHNNSYLGYCVSKELKDIRKSLESEGDVGFVCKDKATAWAASVKLISSSNYWCVDSTGASKEIQKSIISTSCPVN